MPLQDKIAHAADVAKWKADQQIRLFKSQSRINEIENKIKAEKSILADKALSLYAQEQLAEDKLRQICASINALHNQIIEQQNLQEAIRSERAPEQQGYSAIYPPNQQLIKLCQKCGVPMTIQVARKGEHQGEKFYVCPNYIQCLQVFPVETHMEEK
ncbi:MAG: hypothetical protein KA318_07935 [Nitrosomonas sp.]|nr:hypothetical protein [Nitrosomonas sp.]